MKGYRTLLFNVLAAVVTALVHYNWSTVIPPAYLLLASTAITTGGNFILRFLTDTAVGEAK